MFDGLDDVPWNELRHWYGPAPDIPQLLRALTCKDKKRQAQTLDTLGNKICHQASSCPATVPAIPFLLELLRVKSIPNRDQILSLLLHIAVGLDSDQLHYQARISDQLDLMESEASKLTERQKRKPNWGPLLGLKCYHSVRKGIPDFIRLLDDKNRAVRIHAAYILAWFPQHHRRVLPRLREKMRSVRRTDELANAILSVGLLEFQASVSRPSRAFVRPFLQDRRELLRYAAAIYLHWHESTDHVIEVLRELSQNDAYDRDIPIPFCGFIWNQYAECLLNDPHLAERMVSRH